PTNRSHKTRSLVLSSRTSTTMSVAMLSRLSTRRVRMIAVALAAVAGVLASASAGGAATRAAAAPDFGPNGKICDPSMSTAAIKAQLDAIAAQQTDSEFGSGRYAVLFKPGTYGSAGSPLNFGVGYYTQVAGL